MTSSISVDGSSIDESAENKTSCILRDIRVDIVDVEAAKSPAYVILIRPVVGPFTSTLGTIPSHTVARTYSEWRGLYKALLKASNYNDSGACMCVMGSCPFWTMHLLLHTVPFPPKVMFVRSTKLLQTRKVALLRFLSTILSRLQIFRPEIFEVSRTASLSSSDHTNLHACQFLRAIETFLGLSDAIVQQFALVTHKSRLQLTLQGWHLDRQKLNMSVVDDEEE
ncbi:unnamed protein product [Aphanomyces euteiches]|uniref:PX domain-containing protein n=1 Tax=Aphanomyces euteiches TaxID=100861 RepID=A0A6G0XUT3_9STRA|nr:hypothetical protein Ae201684_000822 [Aphanomyces euteiches]KAH9099938.1 hypothetical protein Ae201684P_018944 [Aphanomyces euteiches]KAH9105285.1 hypothetical protein AeMF1_018845 [Aphanomyces euteiches]KAH9126279.1 hypothetical protein LEN26_009388 [Aphanomyces euteiches]KAH9155286.1 hypothetical protein AeRB84_002727 [Aphanomyces euteiches]